MRHHKIKPLNNAVRAAMIMLHITFCLSQAGYSQAEDMDSLIQKLKDKDASVRERAVKALGEIKDTRTVGPLIDALNDRHSSVQEEAARALGQIGDVRAIKPLILILKSKTGYVRVKAVKALGAIGAPAVSHLISNLKNKASAFRKELINALKEIGSPAVGSLVVALKDKDSYVRAGAVESLGEIKDIRAIEPLIAVLKDEKRNARRNAAKALTNIKDERAVKPLIAALKDEDLDIVADAYPFFISKIEPETEIVLAKAINKYGTVEMAEAFRNSGNRCLEKAAEEWTKKEFLQTLHRKILLATNNVVKAKKEAVKRQRRQRKEAGELNKQAVEKAKAKLETIGRVFEELRQNPYLESVRVKQLRRTPSGLKEGESLVKGPITRVNVYNLSAEAREELRKAQRRPRVPTELSSRHRKELQEYKDVEKMADETKRLFLQAKRSIQASTDKPELLKAEMKKWEKAVEGSVKDIDAALRILEEKHRLEIEKERKKFENQIRGTRGRGRRDRAGSTSGIRRRR